MAKIGLNNFRYGLLTENPDGTASYGGAHKPAKAVSCSVSITSNSATLYADDVLAESDTSFQSGTVTIGVDDDDLEVQATLLGHAYEDGEIIRNSNDTAPYVGFGRIVSKMVNGVKKYKVEFLHKVKFSEPSEENQTKGESMEFSTGTLEGVVHQLENGDWSKAKTFTSKDYALTYLESLLDSATIIETFTSSGATVTLAHTPLEINSVLVNGVKTTAYTVSGTTLTFDSAPTSGSAIYVSYSYKITA